MSAQARVNRECRLGGSRGLYFGSLPTALFSSVSWYKLRALSDVDTGEKVRRRETDTEERTNRPQKPVQRP